MSDSSKISDSSIKKSVTPKSAVQKSNSIRPSSVIRRQAMMAVLAALLAVCSQIALPVGAVPITAQTLAVMLIALLLPPRDAALTVLLWVAAGGIGLPFFANFKGGFGVLFAPTGGYIYGFIPAALLISWIAGRGFSPLRGALGCVAGLLLVYFGGALQLQALLDLDSYAAAFLLGAVPYIFFEPIKIAAALWVARMIKKRGLPL